MRAWLPDLRDVLAVIGGGLVVTGLYMALPLAWALIVTGLPLVLYALIPRRAHRGTSH